MKEQKSSPEMEVKFYGVKDILGIVIAEAAAGEDQHDEGGQQQHAARGRKFLEHRPEKFFDDMQAMAAAGKAFGSLGGDIAGIEAVAGCGLRFRIATRAG
jgi:hypothetical protein